MGSSNHNDHLYLLVLRNNQLVLFANLNIIHRDSTA